jgi:hypothetical protein
MSIKLPEQKYKTTLPDEKKIVKIQLNVIEVRKEAVRLTKENYQPKRIFEILSSDYKWLSSKYPNLFRLSCDPEKNLSYLSLFINNIRKVNNKEETFEDISKHVGGVLANDLSGLNSKNKK